MVKRLGVWDAPNKLGVPVDAPKGVAPNAGVLDAPKRGAAAEADAKEKAGVETAPKGEGAGVAVAPKRDGELAAKAGVLDGAANGDGAAAPNAGVLAANGDGAEAPAKLNDGVDVAPKAGVEVPPKENAI